MEWSLLASFPAQSPRPPISQKTPGVTGAEQGVGARVVTGCRWGGGCGWRCERRVERTWSLRERTGGALPECRTAGQEPGTGGIGGMLNSAGGGEAPDRRVEGVMSRPAGEALPQRPRPAPPRPHRWCCCPGCWTLGVGGPALGGTTDTARALFRCPRLPHAVDRFTGATGPPSPQGGEERRVALVAPRAPPHPRAPPPTLSAPPLYSPPLLAPWPPRGRAGPGEAPSRDCALARCALGGPTQQPVLEPRAPCAASGFCCLRRRLRLRASCRDLGSALRRPGLRGPHRIQERRGRRLGSPRPRHGAPGRRLVAAVRGRCAGLLRPRGPCQQEPKLQRSPPDLRRQGLQLERCAPGGDLG